MVFRPLLTTLCIVSAALSVSSLARADDSVSQFFTAIQGRWHGYGDQTVYGGGIRNIHYSIDRTVDAVAAGQWDLTTLIVPDFGGSQNSVTSYRVRAGDLYVQREGDVEVEVTITEASATVLEYVGHFTDLNSGRSFDADNRWEITSSGSLQGHLTASQGGFLLSDDNVYLDRE